MITLPQHRTDEMGTKTVKMEEKEDRISALPDSVIHHILSFLPSTKKAIQTSVLSKRWQNQWTHVPVLIFGLSGMGSDSDSDSDSHSVQDIRCICRFIDNTLIFHDCSKIKKFHITSNCNTQDCNYNAKLRFVIRKEVEELVLKMYGYNYKLLNFFFSNASLIKLELLNFTLTPNGRVNWEHLKDLCLVSCSWSTGGIESIVAGSPLLESLEIKICKGFDGLAIASKSLKRLVLVHSLYGNKLVLEISCPNLLEFSATDFSISDREIEIVLSVSTSLQLLKLNSCMEFKKLVIDSNSLKKLVLKQICAAIVISCPNLLEFSAKHLSGPFSYSDREIENVLSVSTCTSLQLLKLMYCRGFKKLVIDLNSLKKLLLVDVNVDAIVISCPDLKELHLYSLNIATIKLINTSSSICATLDLDCEDEMNYLELGRMMLEQLHHVKELNIGRCFIKTLSALEMTGVSSPLINNKCLSFDGGPNFVENLPGIAYANISYNFAP